MQAPPLKTSRTFMALVLFRLLSRLSFLVLVYAWLYICICMFIFLRRCLNSLMYLYVSLNLVV
jgi:hypothetical protein